MKIKVMKEVDVPEEYCYVSARSGKEDCGEVKFEGLRSVAYCRLFKKYLKSFEQPGNGRGTVYTVLPCKECLEARKRAINEEI